MSHGLLAASHPVFRLSVLWLGVAGLAVLRGGGGGVTGEGAAELREGWVEVRLEVRGQAGDMVVTVVLLRLVTACDSWLDIWQKETGTFRFFKTRKKKLNQMFQDIYLTKTHIMQLVCQL